MILRCPDYRRCAAVAASDPNVEARAGIVTDFKLDQIGHQRQFRPGTAGLDNDANRIRFASQDRFEAAILAIANPSIDAVAFGMMGRPGAEADALDAAAMT